MTKKLAVQILAHGLCNGGIGSAHVITPRPRNEILAAVRDGVVSQMKADNGEGGGDLLRAKVRGRLEHVMLSCVFDMEGLWEVISGLDTPPSPSSEKKEIKDSQDEDDESGSEDDAAVTPPSQGPDIIVITHFGLLMTALFTHRSKPSAHETARLLASHLRHLARSLPSAPLILLLNSTASADTTSAAAAARKDSTGTATKPPLDPTLRSVFNPPPLSGYGPAYQHSGQDLSRRNKPTFGLIFSSFLDLHLLCTRVARTDADADAGEGGGGVENACEYATVVEVLLDEMGVWPGPKPGETDNTRIGQERRFREQRWGAVSVRDGRVVNAFEKDATTKVNKTSEVRVVGGFGGPRV